MGTGARLGALGRHAKAVCAILTFAALLLVLPATAGAYLYWGNLAEPASIGRASLDGTGVNDSFLPGNKYVAGVAVDSRHVYWANNLGGTIGRANLDGTGVNQSFIPGTPVVADVAVDGQFIYWTNLGADSIGRANLDGSGVNLNFIVGANDPRGIEVTAQHVYWSNETSIGRANRDGSGVNQNFIVAPGTIYGLAANSQFIYWGSSGTSVGRANLDGSAPNPAFISGGSLPWGVAVDSQFIYWVNDGSGTMGRANLDGSGVNQSFIPNLPSALGLAVDSLPHGSATKVSCSPSPLTLPGTATCTATVGDTGPFASAPGPTPATGTVSFTTNSGSFSPAASCGLVPTVLGEASCQVTFAPAGAGAAAISVAYPGDSFHGGSSGLTALSVQAAPSSSPLTVVAKPSNRFKMAKPVLNLKKGIAIVPVTVEAPGKLVLSGKKVVFCAKLAKAAGSKVNLLAIPKKNLRERLKEEGSAKTAVRVIFTPTGGEPRTTNLSLTLRLRP